MSRLFNGSSDWAKCTTGQLPEGTLAAWVKAVTLPGTGQSDVVWTFAENSELAGQPVSTYEKTLWLTEAGDLNAYVYAGFVANKALTAGLAANTWHHIGVTFSSADGLRIWLDGTASSATTLGATTFVGYAVPMLAFTALTGNGGAPTSTITRGNVKLQKVGVWTRVLTQTEFDNLVLGQNPSTAAASNLTIEILSDTDFVDTQGGTVTLTGTAFDADNATGGAAPPNPPYTPQRQLTPIFAQ